MTMTDTEAKALAIRASCGLTPYESGALHDYIEATEARHAAELREQAERFSEGARSALAEALKADTYASERGAIIGPILAPFILPAPDPLAAVAAYFKADRTEVERLFAENGLAIHKIGADQ